jgi:T5orf172 domain
MLLNNGKIQDKQGIIYVYTKEGYTLEKSNKFKIGQTRQYTQQRYSQWNRQCGYKPISVYESQTYEHVSELESLIHKDLKEFNFVPECTCPKKHREWFEVDIVTILKSIHLWAYYIEKKYKSSIKSDLGKCICTNSGWERLYFYNENGFKSEFPGEKETYPNIRRNNMTKGIYVMETKTILSLCHCWIKKSEDLLKKVKSTSNEEILKRLVEIKKLENCLSVRASDYREYPKKVEINRRLQRTVMTS